MSIVETVSIVELRRREEAEMLATATLEQAVWGAAIAAARGLGLDEERCRSIADAAMAAAMVAYARR